MKVIADNVQGLDRPTETTRVDDEADPFEEE